MGKERDDIGIGDIYIFKVYSALVVKFLVKVSVIAWCEVRA